MKRPFSKPDPEERALTIALAGNPNAGKTTIFNALTGHRQQVGNYPGVTVEKKAGRFTHAGHRVEVVDLPGIYSLAALSLDELVARNYVIQERPDLVVSVIDTANLERNLYLAIQFMELGVPLLLVLNKMDVAAVRGVTIDTEVLSRLLNVAVVTTVGHKGEGLDELREKIVDVSIQRPVVIPAEIRYGREIEAEIEKVVPALEILPALDSLHRPRWLAVKLLEHDEDIRRRVSECGDGGARALALVDESVRDLERHFGDRCQVVIADQRYGFISGACQEAVRSTVEVRHDMSDRIDEIVTSRVLGVPIFLALMYLLFKVTFTLGAPAMGWIESVVGWLAAGVGGLWPAGSESVIRSLLVDGIIGGVGGVLVFFPNIVLLFAAIAFLEDSGYMSRGAFIVDRFMHRVGLHGRSFIPMMVGFGCTVPAIMATRTLQSRRDRLTTMLVLPLVSCGARFPIYTLLIAAFFPVAWRARMLMLIYLIGVAMALLLARLLRSTVFRGETIPLVMELPPYRMPTVHGILRHTWDRASMFLRKAGTVIVAASVILWVLMNYPKPPPNAVEGLSAPEVRQATLAHSVAGRIGHGLSPVMRHVGFDWRTTTALIGAVAAKEIFVAQLGIVHALGDVDKDSDTLRETLQREYTRLQAFCIMLFCLISVPCIATIAATRVESGRWRYAVLQFVGLTLLAYGVTFVVFQVGTLLGLGT